MVRAAEAAPAVTTAAETVRANAARYRPILDVGARDISTPRSGSQSIPRENEVQDGSRHGP